MFMTSSSDKANDLLVFPSSPAGSDSFQKILSVSRQISSFVLGRLYRLSSFPDFSKKK